MVTEVSNQPTAEDVGARRRGPPTAVPDGTGGEWDASPAPAPAVGRGSPPGSAAEALAPLIKALVGTTAPVRFAFWDGSGFGPPDAVGTLQIRSVDALRRILWAPGELGVARAFVSVTSPSRVTSTRCCGCCTTRRPAISADGGADTAHRDRRRPAAWCHRPAVARTARRVPAGGRLALAARDAAVISHHYDVGNDFYRLVLGPSMTYSCARFLSDDRPAGGGPGGQARADLPQARPRPAPGARLLDVGCGWGSMAIHAARHHRASVVGVALSREQVTGQTPGGRGRAGRPGRDPAPGLP